MINIIKHNITKVILLLFYFLLPMPSVYAMRAGQIGQKATRPIQRKIPTQIPKANIPYQPQIKINESLQQIQTNNPINPQPLTTDLFKPMPGFPQKTGPGLGTIISNWWN